MERTFIAVKELRTAAPEKPTRRVDWGIVRAVCASMNFGIESPEPGGIPTTVPPTAQPTGHLSTPCLFPSSLICLPPLARLTYCSLQRAKNEPSFCKQRHSYIQTTRALMITGSILGLPAVGLLLMSMPCINLGNEPQSSKNKRTVIGGVITLIVGACGLVSTIWFPIGAYHEQGLMSFGFSLYTGWIGTIFSLLSGCMLACCVSESHSRPYQDNNRFYYSKQASSNGPAAASVNHAKSAHV